MGAEGRSVRALAFFPDGKRVAAAAFNRITPGTQDNPLFAKGFPSYNFDAIHGLSYAFDISAPAKYDTLGRCLNPEASRIVDLHYRGGPVTDDSPAAPGDRSGR